MTQRDGNGPGPEDPDGWDPGPPGDPNLPEDGPMEWVVSRVQIFAADPPRYELTIDNKVVTCTIDDIMNRTRLQARVAMIIHRVIPVPHGKNALYTWETMVDGWLDNAEKVKVAPEGSPVMFERSMVKDALNKLVIGDSKAMDDFDRGNVCYRSPKAHVKFQALWDRMRTQFPRMSSADLTEHLTKLGWAPGWVKFRGPDLPPDGKPCRSWFAVQQIYADMSWAGRLGEDASSVG